MELIVAANEDEFLPLLIIIYDVLYNYTYVLFVINLFISELKYMCRYSTNNEFEIISDTGYLSPAGKMSKSDGIVFMHLSTRIPIIGCQKFVSRLVL